MRILLAAIFVCSPALADGPFGVDIGSDVKALTSCSSANAGPGVYICSTLPKTHSAFESYVVRHSPQQGICFVKGVGKDISDSGHGMSIKAAADSLADQIALTYGKHTELTDILLSGSIWNEPREWVMALRQKERYYIYEWAPDGGYVPKNRVDKVYVAASALSSDTGYVAVEFYGDNYDACEAENSASEASAF